MQIVIDIPEEDYKQVVDKWEINTLHVIDAILKGTPLPKEHGRLIDADEVLRYIDIMPSVLDGNGWRYIRRIRLTEYIQDSLPTIIDADKEVGEDARMDDIPNRTED